MKDKNDGARRRELGLDFIIFKKMVLILDARPKDLVSYNAKYHPKRDIEYTLRFAIPKENLKIYDFSEKKEEQKGTGYEEYGEIPKLFVFKGRRRQVLDTMDPYLLYLFPHEHLPTRLGLLTYERQKHHIQRRCGSVGRDPRETVKAMLYIGLRRVIIYDYGKSFILNKGPGNIVPGNFNKSSLENKVLKAA